MTTKPRQNFDIADINLAEKGRFRMQWAGQRNARARSDRRAL